MKQSFALLDVGGTDIKSCIFDIEDSNLQNIYRSRTPGNIKEDKNLFEISPVALHKEIENHILSIRSAKRQIIGMLISGQMGCWLVSDIRNIPITNLISWQDNRVNLNKDEVSQKAVDLLGHDWLITTGNEIRPGLPLFGLESYKKYLPTNQNVRLHTLTSWVSSQLSDDYKYSSHITDFASTGMMDIASKTWSKKALSFLNLDIELPEIVLEMKIIGYSKTLFCPIYAPVGDQQASLYGAELSLTNTVVNIGTGGQVAAILKPENVTALQTRPYFDGQTIETRTHLPAGRLISRWVSNLFPKEEGKEAFAKFLRYCDLFDNDEYLDLSLLEKENSLFKRDNREFLPATILNTVARAYKSAISEINNESSGELIFAGGVGQKIRKLQSLIAETRNYKIAQSEETTLRGLMLLAKTL